MIILSQDEKKIVSTDNLNYIEFEEKEMNYNSYIYIITANFTKEQIRLGKYKTFERAKEVLQDLLKKMNSQKYLLKPKSNIDNETIQSAKQYFENINKIDLIIDDKNFNIIPIGNNETIIYEMPKE
jgi:hypothetical protein